MAFGHAHVARRRLYLLQFNYLTLRATLHERGALHIAGVLPILAAIQISQTFVETSRVLSNAIQNRVPMVLQGIFMAPCSTIHDTLR